MLPKAILLDFDGVIVESVGIKDQAFEELYHAYPQYLPQIMEYHLSHNATIRFTKFRYIAENILKEPYDEQKENEVSLKFSELVFEKIVHCPLVKGAKEFLEYFSAEVPLYLISISPEDELSRILDIRELKIYFKQVYANPTKKSEVFKDILTCGQLDTSEVVYIGDTPEDYQAAVEVSIPFIGIKSKKEFPGRSFPVCNNLEEVQNILSNLK
ncbi:MAG: HAD family hydrolase [Candidatus Scalindua sp.]